MTDLNLLEMGEILKTQASEQHDYDDQHAIRVWNDNPACTAADLTTVMVGADMQFQFRADYGAGLAADPDMHGIGEPDGIYTTPNTVTLANVVSFINSASEHWHATLEDIIPGAVAGVGILHTMDNLEDTAVTPCYGEANATERSMNQASAVGAPDDQIVGVLIAPEKAGGAMKFKSLEYNLTFAATADFNIGAYNPETHEMRVLFGPQPMVSATPTEEEYDLTLLPGEWLALEAEAAAGNPFTAGWFRVNYEEQTKSLATTVPFTSGQHAETAGY